MNTKHNDIAIIGMSGQLPGASNISQFWENICSATESICPVSDNQLRNAGVSETDINDNSYVKVTSNIDDVDKFDPAFFKIAPVEAELMDPQVRLLLQCAWETLEDAGHATTEPQNIGVFAGSGGMTTNYYSHFINQNSRFEKTLASPTHLGNDKDYLSTYISYKLNLTGPSLTIQTACSTSLVAIHQACLSLLNDECHMALAGGVRVEVPFGQGYQYKEGHIFSKSGQVRTFDQTADGVVFGSGLALVLIKKLEEAVKDNDHIYAVIKGSAILNDGKAKLSYAASSAKGQIRCVKSALTNAQVDASTIGYVEAHGTGTMMGDPEEVKALAAAFRSHTDQKGFCAIGSVKPNVGHLDAASGVTSFIKTVLAIYHRVLPPTLHYNKPNPRIKFEKSPFFVNTEAKPWESGEQPRRAGVNSLGVGGTNAFVVLEEYIPQQSVETKLACGSVLIPVSARNQDSLRRNLQALSGYLSTQLELQNEINIYDLAFTLQVGREMMPQRAAFIVSSVTDMKNTLDSYLMDGEDLGSTNSLDRETKDREKSYKNCQQWLRESNWKELADLWCNGFDIDWNELYSEVQPKRISLPTYSFAKERYWIDSGDLQSTLSSLIIHPLVHRNTSNLQQQSYSSIFNGEEFFLTQNAASTNDTSWQATLPTIACLEMIKVAIEQSIPGHQSVTGLQLNNIEWLQPILVAPNKEITVAVFVDDSSDDNNEQIGYEIYSSEAEHEIVHCRGQAIIAKRSGSKKIDVQRLKQQMNQKDLDFTEFYRDFSQLGTDYEPSFHGLNQVYHGDDQLLVELNLDELKSNQDSEFCLKPRLIQASVQACAALLDDLSTLRSAVPVSLDSLTLANDCNETSYALVSFSSVNGTENSTSDDEKPSKREFDIDLLDQHGNVCLTIKKLGFLSSDGDFNTSNTRLTPSVKNDTSEMAWDEKSYLSTWEERADVLTKRQIDHKNVLIVSMDSPYRFEKTIQTFYQKNQNTSVTYIRISDKTEKLSNNEWLCDSQTSTSFQTCLADIEQIDALYFVSLNECQSGSISLDDLSNSQQSNEIQLLRLIKNLKQNQKIEEAVDTYILTLDNYSIDQSTNNYQGAGLTGIAYSLAQGNYQFLVRNIDLSSQDLKSEGEYEGLLAAIINEPASNRGEVFKFQAGKQYQKAFIKLDWNATQSQAFKQGGTYIILGGSGTVGKIFTRMLMQKYNANVIWLGRSDKDNQKIQTFMASYQDFDGELSYIQTDVTDIESMQKAVQRIKQQYKNINGAFFAGQVIDYENSIDQTSEETFKTILEVKSHGSWNFYAALEAENLDFLCYFSSGQAYSFSGAAKLLGYASAITFSESLVQSLQQKSSFPIGIINWGFWKSTIKSIADDTKAVTADNLDALEDEEGFECFEKFLKELQQGRIKQVLCMRVPKQMESLVNCDHQQSITLASDRLSGSRLALGKNIELPVETISALKLSHQQSDLDDWLISALFCQLNRLQSGSIKSFPISISNFKKHCKILDKYTPWLNESLKMLASKKYIELKNDRIHRWKNVDIHLSREQRKSQKEKYHLDPEYKAMASLANDCFDHLPEILQGRTLATDIIFPNASMAKVENVYANNLISDTYNEIVANAVQTYVQQSLQLDPKRRLRILEIGAGTGGTSRIIFPKLRPFRESIEKYCYTDLSMAFLFHAEDNYVPENPYIECQRLDVSKSIASQGIEIGSYDLVVATNVLHATDNIRQTLGNAKAALAKGGFLILNELSELTVFHHLTSGLLDGWWLFEDPELRITNCPGLSPEMWQQVLQEEGFSSLNFPAEDIHNVGQQIIVAKSDGVVRQSKVVEKKKEVAPPKLSASVEEKQQITTAKMATTKNAADVEKYIEDSVIGSLSSTLKMPMENIESQIAFSDYGLDSILGVSFVDQVNKRLSISLNTAIIFDHSSVERLSKHVAKTRLDEIAGQMDLTETSVEVVNEEQSAARSSDIAAKRPRRRFTSRVENSAGQSKRKSDTSLTEIAIIGVSGQFPKAENVNQYWHNLIQGVDGVEELPEHYLDLNYYSEKKEPGKTRCKWGGIVRDRDCFDPLFFNLSPKEAESMNPHQRLILQESWKSIEDAGYNPRKLSGTKAGLFIGAEPTGYYGETFTGYSDAIIASRLSYILDLNGPAFVVNTGCSSSGVALHLACESLKNGETNFAIAGGVNACMNQGVQISLSEIEMLSPSGRCSTFDKSGDGTIISEGVGVVVLKRLPDAIESGDTIYGVICASGVNQDGASNGITAPNGASQEQLILDVYQKFGINPEDISYIEAHGTGTKLGDPIEANALVRAFKRFTSKQDFCVVGSAKSHIGHTAAAAGVTGLIKILMSMKHHKIPKLLHFKNINPLIEFNQSPFYINTQQVEWKPTPTHPRMAALNSFGHSGTNVHLVVREYLPQNENKLGSFAGTMNDELIIPLSARNTEQLRQKAQDLLGFIREHETLDEPSSRIDIAAMAYTLQVGRDAMTERLGFMVSSVAQLRDKLNAYINNEQNIEHLYQGQVNRNNKETQIFNQDEDMQEAIEKWIERKKLSKLLSLWVKGLDLKWNKLYGDIKPQRINLPSYPFAKQRYWFDTALNGSMQISDSDELTHANRHPLVHENISDLSQQLYRSTFNGSEFFLKDHQVRTNGLPSQKVLPGVTYLEMARAAILLALPKQHEWSHFELHNCVWVQPIVVKEPTEVMISLSANDSGQIDYQIFTRGEEINGETPEIVHCQGQAGFNDHSTQTKLDIDQLKAQMNQSHFDAATLYPRFAKMGLNYGVAHQGLKTIYLGEQQLLAELCLPERVESSINDYVLHPSLMDSALQATIGLISDLHQLPSLPSLPFALESLRILSPCSKTMFAWVRYSDGCLPQDQVIKLDIDLCDEKGNVCVQLLGFCSRLIDTEALGTTAQDRKMGSVLAKPVWLPSNLESSIPYNLNYSQRHIILCETSPVDTNQIINRIAATHCSSLSVPTENLAENYSQLALSCFEIIQNILIARPEGKTLLQVVIGKAEDRSIYAGLAGLLKTANLENPNLLGQIILTDSHTTDALVTQLQQEQLRPQDSLIKYKKGVREVLRWQEIKPQQELSKVVFEQGCIFKEHGVYLITGGLGGLGTLFAREILNQASKAKIILSGRSKLTENEWKGKKAKLLTLLPEKNIQLYYRQLDLDDLEQVQRVIASIEKEHNQLNGIIHSAGMILDNFILKKNTTEFRKVLNPKVTGSYHLDIASQAVELDFFAMFSSGSSVIGNLGQADYAAANGFMDQFAVYRNQLVANKERQGQTLAINWPLWLDGGMEIDETSQKQLQQEIGMHPMETQVGMRAFSHSLAMQCDQALVIQGEPDKIRKAIFAVQTFQPETAKTTQQEKPSVVSQLDSDLLLENAQSYLCQQLSTLLKIPVNEIDPQSPMERYGIDSIMAMNLTNALEKDFGSLPKTLFFEYQTISELSEYFIKSYSAKLTALFAANETSDSPPQPIKTVSKVISDNQIKLISKGRFVSKAPDLSVGNKQNTNNAEPIAIIGLSGRYPQARNIEEYWYNLRDGKDCITEVPKERWDWKHYYSEDLTQTGCHFSKWGGFIEGVDEFDPRFFSISPREAESIDPQERLFLEHAWMAVEDSGYTRSSLQIPDELDLPGQVGVYVGVMYGEYNLSGSLASIANRVSYVLNLHGPSMTLDTMCSSSLTAIHVACQDLKQGRTSLAIAGGVNVSIHPNKYQVLSDGQFISSDGHCQSFGEGGDGYIPGEGVGVVVLKKLSEAKRDGHHIYGIVKGSALNHGGKTNGYSVPNPQAQAGAISRALAEANVTSRHVSYIEAHGTGTKLGDPIEIAALSNAFRQHTQDNQFCAIGSAKSNVGHCESAAGIAGLTKVLLQMKHRQIVPSLHSERLNPYIDFQQSPFVVNQTTKDWQQIKLDGQAQPRLAGISSFGAGGSNAHLIVQEYQTSTSAQTTDGNSVVMVPLSARTAEQLKHKANDLLDFIDTFKQASEPENAAINLVDMAYTLQLGRDPMEVRVGFLVNSFEQLQQKLNAYIRDEQNIEGFYQGQVKANKAGIGIISQDDDMKAAIERWIARNKFSKLLDLWVKGLVLDWSKLYVEQKPKWMSLPTYPFAREKYWNDKRASEPKHTIQAKASVLHSLLHVNTSDLYQQSYVSIFNGNENFLLEDPQSGNKRLPTSVYLEMARAAVEFASPSQQESRTLELQNIVWGESASIIDNTKVSIALVSKNSQQINYEIFGNDENHNDVEDKVYCQGSAKFSNQPAPTRLDIETVKAQMSNRSSDRKKIAAIYEGNGQLLVNFKQQPDASELTDVLLDPSIIDNALFISQELLKRSATQKGALVPAAIDSMRIIFACTKSMFALIRHPATSRSTNESLKLDIDLCDEQGNICVQIRGISYLETSEVVEQKTAKSAVSSNSTLSPTYPKKISINFASTRIQKALTNQSFELDLSKTPSKKPTGINLPATNVALSENFKKRVARKSVALPSLSIAKIAYKDQKQASNSEVPLIELLDLGDGIYSIQISAVDKQNTLSSDLIEQLLQAFSWLKGTAELKVLMIAGTEKNFLKGKRTTCNEAIERQLFEVIASFPYPTIAVVEGDATGAGFLVASLCDFMVCSLEASYAFSDISLNLFPTVEESNFFAERFGQMKAEDFLYLSGACRGEQLLAKGWNSPLVPKVQVKDYARTLAEDLASKPQMALGLLKEHLARNTQDLVKAFVVDKNIKKIKKRKNNKIYSPVQYIQLTTHNEVVVIKMTLVDHKYDLKSLLKHLQKIFSLIEQTSYKSVVLASDNSNFFPATKTSISADTLLGFKQLILESSIPVVAALSADSDGAAWFVSLFCEECIYTDVGIYSTQAIRNITKLRKDVGEIYSQQFGGYLAKEILLTGKDYTGKELQQKMPRLRCTKSEQVLDKAIQLAEFLASRPLAQLNSWKQSKALNYQEKINRIPDWREQYEEISENPAFSRINSPTKISLDSRVIKATAHPEGILVIKMEDREAKNMFSKEFIQGMNEVFEHIKQSSEYKVVVISGYASYFASGGTKESLLAIQEGKEKFTDAKVYQLPQDCKLPVIAAMQGHGIGAGWALGMFADLVLFSEESHYFSPYMNYGFTPGAGSTLVFPERIGYDLTRESLLTAREYVGSELKDRGLIFPVLPRDEVVSVAMNVAKQIAQSKREHLIGFKQQFISELQRQIENTYDRELAMHEKTFVGQSKILEQIQGQFSLENHSSSSQNKTPVQVNQKESVSVPKTQADKTLGLGAITEQLKALLAQELYMDESEIDQDTQFVELGLDSITGVTWIRKINDHYQINIEATKVYSYPTLAELSGYVKQQSSAVDKETDTRISEPTFSSTVSHEVIATSLPSTDILMNVTSKLRELLAQELYMDESEIDEDSQFIDLGLDSITGVTWIRKINELYKTSIEATKVYSYPTLTQLALHVKQESGKLGMDAQVPEVSQSRVKVNMDKSVPPQDDTSFESINLPRITRQKLTSWRNKTLANDKRKAEHLSQPIAVIGMAGQFPQARNLQEYWENIAQGRNCINKIPTERWDVKTHYRSGDPVAGKSNSQWMGALQNYDQFDPLFFNISPIEAENMDPQQRVFLQTCWNSIEDAGYNPRSLSGSKCGVFVGCGTGDYQQFSVEQQLSAQGFTGGASSILAARISYFLNLQGPCLSIDTACSSSLVAIANACDSLIFEASDVALAGGVYVMAGPAMHIKTSQSGMLSQDGHCYSFDQRANGFVPGEAVGVIMLKRLEDAQKDQDKIYGVIQGWGVNQDGKTNGITAPNPESQKRLQQGVYDKYQIDPNNIQLIEAHGTGTKLGDPIEVEGLKSAFKKYTNDTSYCALGSVKSNIGHCLTAAGIAGVIKVMLALQHKQLPPTINFEQLNEHIGLDESPFYINSQLKPWERKGANSRQAAISSFGFSGTNAHMVVAEYLPVAKNQLTVSVITQNNNMIVPLSARSPKQLRQKVRDLLDFINDKKHRIELSELAYTLQVGREPMEERLGFLVSSVDQLVITLESYLNNEQPIEGVFRGQVLDNKESLRIISQDADMKETIVEKLLSQTNLSKVLDLWVKGMELDWNKLYPEDKPQRISLPTYPFAQERYWSEGNEVIIEKKPFAQTQLNAASHFHPLLHVNTSNFSQQSYSSIFNGEEFFLADHQVGLGENHAEKVLPGVAYLEMARAAIEQAMSSSQEPSIIELRNTVWARPIVVSGVKQVSIALLPNEHEQIDFEIYSQEKTDADDINKTPPISVIHGQGQVAFIDDIVPDNLDFGVLKSQMQRGLLTQPEIYSAFTSMGLYYGQAHQGISNLYLGENQVLAELEIPEIISHSEKDYWLHPALMDSALQASIGLVLDLEQKNKQPSLPFSLETLRIFKPCEKEMFAWVRYSQSKHSAEKIVKFDIDLCDVQGNICVQMLGFSSRILEPKNIALPDEVLTKVVDEKTGENSDTTFDDDFYANVIESVLNDEISIEEAADLE